MSGKPSESFGGSVSCVSSRRLIAVAAARRIAVVLLVLVAVGLAVEVVRPATPAVAELGGQDRSGGLLAVAGKISEQTYGLYLIDRESGTMTVYQWLPATRKLELLAARNCIYDLQLDEYNTKPSPSEIKRLVRQGRSLSSLQPPEE